MGGGRLSRLISVSVCESVSVSCRQSGAVFNLWVGEIVVPSRLVGLGELVLGVVESGLFSLKREDSGECLFVVSSMILLCILGVILGFIVGLGCPGGVSPLGLGLGLLWASLVL